MENTFWPCCRDSCLIHIIGNVTALLSVAGHSFMLAVRIFLIPDI